MCWLQFGLNLTIFNRKQVPKLSHKTFSQILRAKFYLPTYSAFIVFISHILPILQRYIVVGSLSYCIVMVIFMIMTMIRIRITIYIWLFKLLLANLTLFATLWYYSIIFGISLQILKAIFKNSKARIFLQI